MNEIESQIAKIQLGNRKSVNSYVYIMAEKAPVGNSELYLVAELPLLNPAAEESCERICLAIASTLKRTYRKVEQINTFENAITNINEELGKLTSLGQTQWVNKLNCVIAVKSENTFHVASCGKISAFLLRSREYTDISCSPTQNHPLKTFENYASGKIKLGDLIILSTTQLFNHLSMDRLLNIVEGTDFLTATKTVIEMLKETAEPQVAFGVLFNLQVPIGQTIEAEEDLENYIVERTEKSNIFVNFLAYIKTIFAIDKNKGRIPKVDIPKISLGQRMNNLKGSTLNMVSKSKNWVSLARNSAQNIGRNVKVSNLKNLSKQKKFLLISVIVLAFAVILNITIALKVKTTKVTSSEITSLLNSTQELLLSAQGSILYKDEGKAADYFKQAKEKMPEEKNIDKSNKELYSKVLNDFKNTQNQLDKIYEPQVNSLGSIGQSDNLISLPNYLATQINQTIVSYNKQNSKIEDGVLNLPITSLKTIYTNGNLAGIYDGTNLYSWDFSNGNLSIGFNQIVPNKSDWAGLAYYPTNSRLYLVDKKSGAIVNFAYGKSGVSKPVVAVRDSKLADAIDLTIDSSIYVLTKEEVLKYQAGKPVEFSIKGLSTPFSGTGKIFTQKDFNYVYLLDSGNNRILILNKKGGLINSLKSNQFTNLKDFSVDESGKVIYVLNEGVLLKVSLP